MDEVLYEPVAETAKERKAVHHFVLDQRSADGSIGAERVEVAGADPGRSSPVCSWAGAWSMLTVPPTELRPVREFLAVRGEPRRARRRENT